MEFFNGDLASLLQPLSIAEFFSDYWGKQPLYIQRENRNYYQGLYSSANLDDFLRFSAPIEGWNEKVKMAIKFKMVTSAVLFDHDQPGFDYQMIRKSQRAVSLIMNYIQEHDNRVANMARVMERNLQGRIKARVNVNAYLSPGNSYINPHVDSHDELNLQLEGTKRWRVYEPRIVDPFPGMPLDSGSVPESKSHYLTGRKPMMEIVLQPGDFIYMPRGFWHDPVNIDNEPSLGLTIGIHPLCWLDTVIVSAKAAAENRPELRQSIPAGLSPAPEKEQLLRKSLDDFSAAMPAWASLPEMRANLRRDVPDEGLSTEELYCPSPAEVTALGPDSLLSRPCGISWAFHQSYGLLRLKVGGRELGLRKELKEALEQIRDSAFFMPKDLAGELSEGEKIRFCSFLLNFGAIELDPAKGAQ